MHEWIFEAQSVLFDAPGPRARRRHAVLAGVGALLALAALYFVLRKMQTANQLQAYMWEPFLTDRSVWRDYLLKGLWGTLKAALISIVLAAAWRRCRPAMKPAAGAARGRTRRARG